MIGIVRDLRQDHFDRNVAMQPSIATAIDRSHSAFANLRDDFIGTEILSDHDTCPGF